MAIIATIAEPLPDQCPALPAGQFQQLNLLCIGAILAQQLQLQTPRHFSTADLHPNTLCPYFDLPAL